MVSDGHYRTVMKQIMILDSMCLKSMKVSDKTSISPYCTLLSMNFNTDWLKISSLLWSRWHGENSVLIIMKMSKISFYASYTICHGYTQSTWRDPPFTILNNINSDNYEEYFQTVLHTIMKVFIYSLCPVRKFLDISSYIS